jgi:hypothetical protein
MFFYLIAQLMILMLTHQLVSGAEDSIDPGVFHTT